MRRRVLLTGLAGIAGAGAVSGCLGRSSGAETHDIGMSSMRFLPSVYEVAPGTTVVWKNTSSRPHTVTAYEDGIPEGTPYFASGGYDSETAARDAWREEGGGGLAGGETYAHTFETPGEYAYFCVPHVSGGMVGRIDVTEEATRTPNG